MASLRNKRRVLGPPDTQPLFMLPLKPKSTPKSTPNKIPATETTKQEPPACDEPLPPLFIQPGVVANANGSVFFEISNSSFEKDTEKLSPHIQIQASVHGPRPVRGSFLNRNAFNVDVKFSPFAVSQLDPLLVQSGSGSSTVGSTSINVPSALLESGITSSGGHSLGTARPNGSSPLEKMICQFVKDSLEPSILLEKYPKSGIDVFITVLNRGAATAAGNKKGGKEMAVKELAAACVNAASVALVDAGIQVKDVVTCGHAFVDHSSANNNENTRSAALTFAVSYMTASSNEIVALAADGAGFGSSLTLEQGLGENEFTGAVLTPDVLDEGLEKSLKSATNARTIINSALLQQFVEKEEALKHLVGINGEDSKMQDSSN